MLFCEPILALITAYMSMVYGLLYALFEAFPVIFGVKRGLGVQYIGLLFFSVAIGTVSGGIFNLWASRKYPKLLNKWHGFPPPERRLYAAMLGGPMLVIGAFWLGWTGEYASVGWYVPVLAGIPLGMGVTCIFISFMVSGVYSLSRAICLTRGW